MTSQWGMAMLTLYYAPGSSSLASHIALEESGVQYATRFVDEDAGEQITEAYLQVNPRGKVPALRLEDGSVLVENVAIQSYVAHVRPQAGLLPDGVEDEARALSLMAWFASAVHPAFSHYHAPQRFAGASACEAGVRARGLQMFMDHCREIDARLTGRDWFFDRFSVVDGYAFVFYGWGLRARSPMRELTAFTAHAERVLARPAVRRVLQREGVTPPG